MSGVQQSKPIVPASASEQHQMSQQQLPQLKKMTSDDAASSAAAASAIAKSVAVVVPIKTWTAAEANTMLNNWHLTAATETTISAQFVCAICLDLVYQPWMTPCEHFFCGTCLYRLQLSTKPATSTVCPQCRHPAPPSECRQLNDPLSGQKALWRILQSVIVVCPIHSSCCDWKGEYGLAQKHSVSCPLQPVQCPSRCGIFIRPGDILRHNETCPNRSQPCVDCTEPVRVTEAAAHAQKCPLKMLTCREQHPIDGCSAQYVRSDEARHRDQNCTERRAACELQYAGCTFTGRPVEMLAHMKDAAPTHVALCLTTLRFQRNFLIRILHNHQLAKLGNPETKAKRVDLTGDSDIEELPAASFAGPKAGLSGEVVLATDTIVDCHNRVTRSWCVGSVTEHLTPMRVSVSPLDGTQPLVFSLPADAALFALVGTHTRDRTIWAAASTTSAIATSAAAAFAADAKALAAARDAAVTKADLDGRRYGYIKRAPISGLYSEFFADPWSQVQGEVMDVYLPGPKGLKINEPGTWVLGSVFYNATSILTVRPMVVGAMEVHEFASRKDIRDMAQHAIPVFLLRKDSGALVAPAGSYVPMPRFVGAYGGALLHVGQYVLVNSTLAGIKMVGNTWKYVLVRIERLELMPSSPNRIIVTMKPVGHQPEQVVSIDLKTASSWLALPTENQINAFITNAESWRPYVLQQHEATLLSLKIAHPSIRGALTQLQAADAWVTLLMSQVGGPLFLSLSSSSKPDAAVNASVSKAPSLGSAKKKPVMAKRRLKSASASSSSSSSSSSDDDDDANAAAPKSSATGEDAKQPKRKRQKRDPSLPKLPRPAYLYFCQSERPKIRQENKSLSYAKIAGMLGSRWARMNVVSRKPFTDLSKADQARYHAEMERSFSCRNKGSSY
jgi:hypothetical protein